MGRRGPPPTPTVMRLLRGNPGKRPINHDEPKPEALSLDNPLAKCPRWMTGAARELWKRVAPGAIKAGLITVVDLPAFEALCQSYARWREYERLTGKNLELAISKGFRNGAVRERQLMMQFGARFGFDPSSRSNVKTLGSLVSPNNQQSKADRFRQAKTGA